jgi:hypothetical protein
MPGRDAGDLRRIKWYVDYVLDLIGIELDENGDLVAQVRDKLEETVEEARRGRLLFRRSRSTLGEVGRLVLMLRTS